MKWLLAFILSLVTIKSNLFAQVVLIPFNSAWKYQDKGSDEGTAWRNLSFKEAGWKSGNGKFGYGSSGINTTVSYGTNPVKKNITTYFRKTIDIANPASNVIYSAGLFVDDGVVVYINGKEIVRKNMPSGNVVNSTLASNTASDDGRKELRFTIPHTAFVKGKNIIAIEVHQYNSASSAMLFDFKLYVDQTPPALEKIKNESLKKDGPNVSSVVNRVVFTEKVRGVDPSDFIISTVSGSVKGKLSANSVMAVDEDSTEYFVSVSSISGKGVLRLDLKNNNTGISDASNNRIANGGFTSAQTFTFDNDPPMVVNIGRHLPSTDSTSATTLVYRTEYSEGVMGVDTSDFALSVVSGSVSGKVSEVNLVNGSEGRLWDVTVNSVAGNGVLRLNAVGTGVTDSSGNALASNYTTGQTYTLTRVVPILSTVHLSSNNASPFLARVGDIISLAFSTNEAIIVNNIQLAGQNVSAQLVGNNSYKASYTLTGNEISGPVMFTIFYSNASGEDGTEVSATTDNSTVSIDHNAPMVMNIGRHLPSTDSTSATTLVYRTEYSEGVMGVDTSDFALSVVSGSVSGKVSEVNLVNGSEGRLWDVTVSSVAGNGVLRLNAVGTGVTDSSGNTLAGAYSAGQSYAIHQVILQGFASIASLQSLPIRDNTKEKPQAKTWKYAGKWWSVLPTSAGIKVYRLDNTSWTDIITISSVVSGRADCKVVDTLVHILFHRGPSKPAFVSTLEYDEATGKYKPWSKRPTNSTINMPSGAQTSTLTVDGNGRMWVASDATSTIQVWWSDAPYTTWSAPITLATGVKDADLCAITTLPGKIGVMWSNQITKRFGFKTHTVTDDPSVWSADEMPASQSAINNVGGGMADSHINLVEASDSTLYCAVKTAYDKPNYEQLALLVRRPSGNWDNLYPVTIGEGTQPILVMNEAQGKMKVVYTSGTNGGEIVYRESAIGNIAFGESRPLITGGGSNYNFASATHQTFNPEVVILATNQATDPLQAVSVLASDNNLDHTPPMVLSISRFIPASVKTGDSMVVYRVVFSEKVTGVGIGDFVATAVSGNITGTVHSVVAVSANATTYDVTVRPVVGDGVLRLDVKASNTGIYDAAGNAIQGGFTNGNTYTVSQSFPVLTNVQITSNNGSVTKAKAGDVVTLQFTASEALQTPVVTIASQDAFVAAAGSSKSFTATYSIKSSDAEGVVPFTINFISQRGTNGIQVDSTTDGSKVIIDNSGSTVVSINRKKPISSTTVASSLVYRASFSEKVTGVDSSDFVLTLLSGNVTGKVFSVTAADTIGNAYDITVNSVTGDGVLRLDLKPDSTNIFDAAGNKMAGGFTNGESYTLVQSSLHGFSSVTPLASIPISIYTKDKPQSKIWKYGGKWWNVLATSNGTKIFRLDGTSWTDILTLSSTTSSRADCKVVGNLVHILMYRGGGDESYIASLEYDAVNKVYKPWAQRPTLSTITFPSNSETATIIIDGSGKMWVAADSEPNIEVRWSDAPYTTWSAPITIATGIKADDICTLTLLKNKIGIFWSNQNTQRFGFRTHLDTDAPTIWSPDEVPASQSAIVKGYGMGDDHMNLKVATDGTLYCAVKTGYNTMGFPQVSLLVRRPTGTWDDLYQVTDHHGTQPLLLLNETLGTMKVVYTTQENGGNILYKESLLSDISFSGAERTLISGGGYLYNYASSTQQSYHPEVVILATNVSTTPSLAVSLLATDIMVDKIEPSVVSILRQAPMTDSTNVTEVTFRASFSEGVIDVDTSDFAVKIVSGSLTGRVSAVNAVIGSGGKLWDVMVSSVAGNGVLRLDAVGSGITDSSGNVLSREYTSGQSYIIQQLVLQGFVAITPLEPIPIRDNTKEKPQAKAWKYAGKWWSVLPTSGGIKVYRLDGTSWTDIITIASVVSGRADCRVTDSLVHILVFRAASKPAHVATLEYDAATGTYKLWKKRPSNSNINMPAGAQTATLALDGNGRMWVASDATNSIQVWWSDAPYATWSAPITLTTAVRDADLCAITTLPGKIGVMWSNQNTKRFGFMTHTTGDDPTIWSADETPASQSAIDNVGGGMADNHLNLKVTSDGTLYCVVKTAYNKASYPQLALLVRRPSGVWDNLYPVSMIEGTQPILVMNEAQGKMKVIYTSGSNGGDIVYRESALSNIAFGEIRPLITGGGSNYNYSTSTHQTYNPEVVILATNQATNPQLAVSVLASDSAAANGGGLAAARLGKSLFSTDENSHQVQAGFLVAPNPFTTNVNISFKLAESSSYHIVLYNSKGEMIQLVKQGWSQKGIQNIITVDGTKISSGLYFLTIKSSNGMSTIKLFKN